MLQSQQRRLRYVSASKTLWVGVAGSLVWGVPKPGFALHVLGVHACSGWFWSWGPCVCVCDMDMHYFTSQRACTISTCGVVSSITVLIAGGVLTHMLPRTGSGKLVEEWRPVPMYWC